MKVIANEYFNVLMNLETATDYIKERKQLKHSLLERLVNVLGRSYRKARKVAAVIDEITYKATDRGFSFNGRDTLAQRVGVSLPTVDRAIKLLKESGRVVVAYRENPNSNGAKTPVIIFKDHANFKRISAILKLRDNVVDKVEKDETLTETGGRGVKIVATNTYRKQDNHIYNGDNHTVNEIVKYVSLKVSDAMKKGGRGIHFLSSYVDKVIQSEENNAYYKANETYRSRRERERERLRRVEAPGFDWIEKTASMK
ncbi:hypothetical protein [Bacillus solitudinis]|uniref:hypothetical protein n=1 Tax=Bacillus solitudinis TaxID=2014074 RepID=UPI000C2363E6|nr:hypothetical protein [Bacillus solitudinis]